MNRAASAWNTDPGLDPPTSPTYPFQNYGVRIEAPLDVIEPDVGIAKTVSDPNPEPGDPPFTYTLVVTNGPDTFDAADPNDPANFVSGAYNLTVTDLVPAGIVVDPATISNGGVYDESTRTITWSRGTPGLADGPLCGRYEAAEGLCTGPTELR